MTAGWQVVGNSTVQILNLDDDYLPIPGSTETQTTIQPELHQDSLAVTGHSMVYVNIPGDGKYVIITGGMYLDEQYAKKEEFKVVAYTIEGNRFNVKSWARIRGRYGHSSAFLEHENQHRLWVYGGRISTTEEITNEMWIYDIFLQNWSKVETDNFSSRVPKLVDHRSIHCNLRNGTNIILTVFGYSPKYGFTNWIHEFIDQGSKIYKFRKVKTNGYLPTGTASHSIAYSSEMEAIFIYGGYRNNPKPFASKASPLLLKYLVAERRFIKLEPSVSYFGRYQHSAEIILDKMYVFGGRTISGDMERDAFSHLETQCISEQILVYDIKCDRWDQIITHDTTRRIGHSTQSYLEENETGNLFPRIILFGGFNGTTIASMAFFSPGIVNRRQNEQRECPVILDNMSNWSCNGESQCTNCLAAKTNKCGYCAHSGDLEGVAGSSSDACTNTYSKNTAEASGLDLDMINNLQGLSDADSSSFHNRVGRSALIPQSSPLYAGYCPAPIFLKQTSQCRGDGETKALCSASETCTNCITNKECVWIISGIGLAAEKSFCQPKPTNSSEWPLTKIIYPFQYDQCSKKDSCYAQKNCHTCLNLQCLFCNNRCISKAGYVSEFPYGQCPRLKRFSSVLKGLDECPVGNIESTSEFDQCQAYKSCDDCHKHAYCGWCNFGDNTGLGKCQKGGHHGPDIEGLCDSKLNRTWHFISCPECNCNGHSECYREIESEISFQKRIEERTIIDRYLVKNNGITAMVADEDLLNSGNGNDDDDQSKPNFSLFDMFEQASSNQNKEKETVIFQNTENSKQKPIERIEETKCGRCRNLTTGKNCEVCQPGYFGDSRNGGSCQPCECYGRAEMCVHNTGECLCNTMWTAGEKCDKCIKPSKDMNFRRYWSNVTPEYTCFIELPINFEYTFTLNKKHEHYIKRLNAIAFPDIDPESTDQQLTITIETSSPVTVQFTLGSTYTDDPNDKDNKDAKGQESTNVEEHQSKVKISESSSEEGNVVDRNNEKNCSRTDNQCEKYLWVTKTDKKQPKIMMTQGKTSGQNTTNKKLPGSEKSAKMGTAAKQIGLSPEMFDSILANQSDENMQLQEEDLEFTTTELPLTTVESQVDYSENYNYVDNVTDFETEKNQNDEILQEQAESTNSDQVDDVFANDNNNNNANPTQNPQPKTTVATSLPRIPEFDDPNHQDDPRKFNYEVQYTYRLDENNHHSPNTSIRIYITDFKTPILLKIRVSKASDVDLIMFFTIFFSCFLSLLVLAFIGWRIKSAYDDFHRRQQQELALMRMAARPFNNITIRCDQDARNPFLSTEQGKKEMDPPTAICKQPFQGDKIAVVTFVVWLPGERTNISYYPDDNKQNPPMKSLCTPYGQTAIGLGSTMVKLHPNDTEFGPNAQTFESMAERRAREIKEKKKKEKEKAALREQVDPSQSRGTTKRIENWLNAMPEKPDLDKYVEDMNLMTLPTNIKGLKPRPGEGDKHSINVNYKEPPREDEEENEANKSSGTGQIANQKKTKDRSRAASQAKTVGGSLGLGGGGATGLAHLDEEDLNIQMGEEAGGINGGEDILPDMTRGFTRDHRQFDTGVGRPHDDVLMM